MSRQQTLTARAIDDAVEFFEQRWREDTRCQLLLETLESADQSVRSPLLAELLRVDIDRCYAAGVSVDLNVYRKQFSELRIDRKLAAVVCYEDFRGRRRRGLSLFPERWAEFPGVADESWYLEAMRSHDRESLVPVTETLRSETGEDGSASWKIGDFEIQRVLGQGAFSKVYLARQLSLGGRFVAIKVVSRPMEEPWHLARLQHTGIVPIYSCHRVADQWVLCMPYSGSATLADWLKGHREPESRTGRSLVETVQAAQDHVTLIDQPVPSPTPVNPAERQDLKGWHDAAKIPLTLLSELPQHEFAVWLFRKLASALAHAHQRGIVHGDLKPANILLRNDGEPALIDFNLSHSLPEGHVFWKGGTLAYMAPEHLSGLVNRKPVPSGTASDVYSLGVILFEVVEGRLPFPAPESAAESDLQTVMKWQQSGPVFRNRRVALNGIHAIIAKCLSFRAEDRYRSGVELLEDLDRESALRPLKHAREPLFGSRLPKFVRRHPTLFSTGSAVTVACLLLVLLSVVAMQYREHSLRLAAVEASASFANHLDRGLAELLTTTASDGRQESQDLQLSLRALSLSDGMSSGYQQIVNHLNEPERESLRQRAMAVTFVKALAGRPKAPDATLSQFGSLLPEDFESSSVGELLKKLKDLRSEGGALRTGDLAAGDASSAEKVLSAFALLLLHRAQEANELLETVEPPESLRLVYWLVKGRTQLEMNEPRKAVASFSMVLRGTDPLASVLFNRGNAYFRMGAFDDADRDFTESLRHRADHVETLVNRHAVRLSMGRKEEALADLNRAIELAPDSARLRLIRSRTLRQLGRLKASKADLDLAMTQIPKSADDWLAVAVARLATDPAQALRDLQTAENQFGPSSSVLQTMAHVYSEHLQQPEEAIQVLTRLLKAEPGFQKALSGRAVLYARGGKTDLALADIQSLEAQGSAVTAESVYQIACAQSLCSRDNPELVQSALSNLAFAVQRNYGVELLLSDPDLEPLRSQPGFDALVQMSRLIRRERTTASQ